MKNLGKLSMGKGTKYEEANNQFVLYQGSKGIRQWVINRCTSQIMLNKITPSVDTISGCNVCSLNFMNQPYKFHETPQSC